MAMKLDRRAHGRRRVNILASLTHAGGILSCSIVELSEAGARVRLVSESAVLQGNVRLVCAECGDLESEVVWQNGPLVGLKFMAVPRRAAGVVPGSKP